MDHHEYNNIVNNINTFPKVELQKKICLRFNATKILKRHLFAIYILTL